MNDKFMLFVKVFIVVLIVIASLVLLINPPMESELPLRQLNYDVKEVEVRGK